MLIDVSLEKAQNLLLGTVYPLEGETVDFMNALGRISFKDIYTPHDIPSCPQAAVDGYAICMKPKENYCEIIEHAKEKDISQFSLKPGQALRVLTGGNIPMGTQAVIPQERAKEVEKYVAFSSEVQLNINIKPQGEDFKSHELLVKRGMVISPGLLGILGSYGINSISLFQKPRVGIISLGREIVPSSATLQPGQMRDSNGPLLAALVQCDGGKVSEVKVSSNEGIDQGKSTLENLLQQNDIVITIGGTASGDNDQALNIARNIGGEILFWGVNLTPGSHSGGTFYNNKLIISLSGNPAACATGYHLLVAPVLRALQGQPPYYQGFKAKCNNSFAKKTRSRRFLQGYAFFEPEGWRVSILPGQKSSMQRALINSNVLIDLPAGVQAVEEGNELNIIPLNSFTGINNKQQIDFGDK